MVNKMAINYSVCGLNQESIVVSDRNEHCPCLNCVGCNETTTKCPLKYVFQTEPCALIDRLNCECRICVKTTGLQK